MTEKTENDHNHRLQRCPYAQHLKIFCGESNCEKADCPIWLEVNAEPSFHHLNNILGVKDV